ERGDKLLVAIKIEPVIKPSQCDILLNYIRPRQHRKKRHDRYHTYGLSQCHQNRMYHHQPCLTPYPRSQNGPEFSEIRFHSLATPTACSASPVFVHQRRNLLRNQTHQKNHYASKSEEHTSELQSRENL